MVVVDVGANIGYHTLLAAEQVGGAGHVWSVEPAEGNLGFLRHNIELNGFENVTILPHAAGARRSLRRFLLRSDSGHHGFHAHPTDGTVEEVEIEEVPLDDLIRAPVDLVKLDVEGSEIEALEGMRRLLTDSPTVRILVEWNPPMLAAAGLAPNALPDWLRDAGFDLSVVNEEPIGRSRPPLLRPFDASALDLQTEHNLLAARTTGGGAHLGSC
jgi:FkbM family methyltransferase